MTGDEPAEEASMTSPMTEAQRRYLTSLALEVGERLPDTLTRDEADAWIERLQLRSGRGLGG